MTISPKNHPCLNCSLPDCVDDAFGCALQAVRREYMRRYHNKLPISDELRTQYGIAYRELFTPERNARLSEADA